MFHEPSLSACHRAERLAKARPDRRRGQRDTATSGPEVPKKFGCVTFVMSSVSDTPPSLAGSSCPVTIIGISATWRSVGNGQSGTADIRDEDLDRVNAGASLLTPASA